MFDTGGTLIYHCDMNRVVAVAITAIVCSNPASGNEPPTYSFPPEVQVRLQEKLTELRRVEERLQPIRNRAEEDDMLVQIKESIADDVLTEVKNRFPETASGVDRIRSLQQELAAYSDRRSNGDAADAQDELDAVREELRPSITEVRNLPEFRVRIRSYESRVQEVMQAISPEAENLLARRQALHTAFRELQRTALEAIRDERAGEPGAARAEEAAPYRPARTISSPVRRGR